MTMRMASCLDQTCTRTVERDGLNAHGEAVVIIRICGTLVSPGHVFCDCCELEIAAHLAAELESDAA